MADYDWGKPCCGMTVGHKDSCLEHPIYKVRNRLAVEYRPQGLVLDTNTGYYLCRRGCGTLVHDPETHIKNVCTRFEPVVGDDA